MLLKPLLNTVNFRIITRKLVSSTVENGVQTIKMCDKKTRNSLSLGMMQNLIENISKHKNDNSTRAIIVSSEGPVFSAGHNLKELSSGIVSDQNAVFDLAKELMITIIDSPLPVIARIDGLAAAAGCQFVAQCDFAFCTEKSTFSTPGANFGIFCSTPGVALARSMHRKAALDMLLTGLPVPSRRAQEIGLVTKVLPDETQLDDEIQRVCDAIKAKSRSVIQLGKEFYYKQVNLDIKNAYEVGGRKMVENLQMEDGKEGISSFVEKRKPVWRN